MSAGPDIGDAWYESEEPTRVGMVTELQRIKRRMIVRPIPVILLALFITSGIMYKVLTKERLYEADVVMALDEGSLSSGQGSIPFDQLKEYVTSVLMPDAKLLALIEKRDLHRLRRTLGPQWALGELRMQLEVEIWKNSFVYFHESDSNAQKSARIGLTVIDTDPDDALAIAHDIASIVIETHEEQRRRVADVLAQEVKVMHATVSQELSNITLEITMKQAALTQAKRERKTGLASALMVDLSALADKEKKAEQQLHLIATSPDAVADRVTRAGLDTTLRVVEERRPDRQEQSWFVMAMILVVVGTSALLGAAMFVGAFDSRVHDTDDVARLGLPVLGHVPGFPGDDVGSMQARGALRARVPLSQRWRSQR